ncbi:MAG: hypothetical protein FWF81_12450 [Defluviitaleaceae bacterium]|nr:hypothetical protein [Defluviitaleaceae bacterium]
MSYQLNKSHLIISILAALVLAAGFVWHRIFGPPFNLFTMAMWVSSAIVMFYVIGHIARNILINKVFLPFDDEYDFSQDEEYQEFMASFDDENAEPSDVMLDDPSVIGEVFEDSLEEPFMVPLD